MSGEMDYSEWIEILLRQMVDQGYSDCFLHEGAAPRMRFQGQLIPLETDPCPREVFSELANRTGVSLNAGQTYDKSLISAEGYRFRLNLFSHLNGAGAVIRQLNSHVPDLGSLGLPAEMLQKWVNRSAGLILIAGPPGSGKSTTTASMLNWVDRNKQKHIICIEDPIEYIHSEENCLFTHREVGHDVTSFAEGMEQALRQSPDIIFLGEIRDLDTAFATLHAAETGHLVLATVHGSSSTEALERFVQIFPDNQRGAVRLILSNSLVGILFQKLIINTSGAHIPALEYFETQGLIATLIREGRNDALRDQLQSRDQEHQCSFVQHLVTLTRNGEIDEDIAQLQLTNPQDFQRAMKGIR